MQLIFRIRSLDFLFNKNWYSLYRWKNPQYYSGSIFKLIDIGMFTIGYRTKNKRRK